MNYRLIPATDDDRAWLEQLRRAEYRELFDATFGGWDEARHVRHFEECWERRKVVLSVALKNERAYRLYTRLGFKQSGANDTHNQMVHE